jgi:exodeoxyribonuclease VII small subunit
MTNERKTDESGHAGAFDDKLGRLERIVGELEQGGLGLEPAIERYQEGLQLLKECHRALETYKKRVEELTREAEAAMRPFEGDPDFPGEAAGTGRAGARG